jgi:hypothetical protein
VLEVPCREGHILGVECHSDGVDGMDGLSMRGFENVENVLWNVL